MMAVKEIMLRLKRWVSSNPEKCCRSCCITCPYYAACDSDVDAEPYARYNKTSNMKEVLRWTFILVRMTMTITRWWKFLKWRVYMALSAFTRLERVTCWASLTVIIPKHRYMISRHGWRIWKIISGCTNLELTNKTLNVISLKLHSTFFIICAL